MARSTTRMNRAVLIQRLCRAGGLLALILLLAFPAAAFAAPVDPASVTATLAPGTSMNVTKTVHTPTIPPKPDIVFLADTTGSMGSAIANVKTNATALMTTIKAAQPDAQFGVANYKDFNCDLHPYLLDQAITSNTSAAQAAINTWSAGGGCDTPEAQLNALYQLATDPGVGFRSGSSRIIVWFGDEYGHNPSNGISEGAATSALVAAGIRVIAISTGANQLNATGQASRITAATGGELRTTGEDVSGEILAGLHNLPVTVTPSPVCSTGLTATYDAASKTVTSGQDATFTETIAVAADAPGGALTCTVNFLLNGNPTDGFVQTIQIKRPLTVTANDATRVYGDPNPAFSATAVGLGAGDTLAGIGITCASTATTTSDVGTYPITCSGTPANYDVTFVLGTLTVTKAPTQLAITSGGALAPGTDGKVTVTARLTWHGDTVPVAGQTVTFTAGGQSASGTTDANGVATAKLALPSEKYTLTASFAGSTNYLPSNAAAQTLIVYVPTQFVIWGGNAGGVATGKDYQFWGAQWAKQVTGGDYRANNSFKGYADILSADGKTWIASPGGSGNPPATVAPYIGVIVATHATKDGSTINGNVAQIVVLKVDDPASYQPNPGHAGTGVLVATLP